LNLPVSPESRRRFIQEKLGQGKRIEREMKKIYVGNMPWSMGDDELSELFESFGNVVSATIITDRETGRSRGFGFVEMAVDEEALAAIEALNGTESGGRTLTVNEARPRTDRRGGGGGGGGGGRGGYGGGGGGGGGGRRDRW
jgi:RNA recognition motif-containing protein